MNKRRRHRSILDIVRQQRIPNQEALREQLLGLGAEVTQATLSRDIRELRLVKVPDGDGTSHYAVPEDWDTTPALTALLPALFASVEGVGNLLVIHTLKGGAQTVAAGIDAEGWPEVVGTIAGDDTILLILRDVAAAEAVRGRVESMAGAAD